MPLPRLTFLSLSFRCFLKNRRIPSGRSRSSRSCFERCTDSLLVARLALSPSPAFRCATGRTTVSTLHACFRCFSNRALVLRFVDPLLRRIIRSSRSDIEPCLASPVSTSSSPITSSSSSSSSDSDSIYMFVLPASVALRCKTLALTPASCDLTCMAKTSSFSELSDSFSPPPTILSAILIFDSCPKP